MLVGLAASKYKWTWIVRGCKAECGCLPHIAGLCGGGRNGIDVTVDVDVNVGHVLGLERAKDCFSSL